MAGIGERRRTWATVAVAAVGLAGLVASPLASALRPTPGPTHVNDNRGRFVPIPDRVPHAEGAYIDKRIRRNLVWIARHFRIYVVEGFAGRLPDGERVGCPKCHVGHSEHRIGLAVDIVPLHNDGSGRCNRRWASVSKLARWAEPRQNRPLLPFRWVGYDGDEGHGCGNHLHLSWAHDPAYHRYRPSGWVELFRVRRRGDSGSKALPSPAAPWSPAAPTASPQRPEYEPSP